MATCLGHGRRARGDLTSRRHRRGDGTRAVGSAWTPVRTSVRGASTSPRAGPSRIRSRRDAILSESSLSSSSSSSSSLGDSSSGSTLCLDLDRRASKAWRSRFFFFSPFFLESLADFDFSTDRRRASRSTSSSLTGGLEDRTSIRPCQNKGGFREKKRRKRNPESRLRAKKKAYQIDRAFVGPHREAIDVL